MQRLITRYAVSGTLTLCAFSVSCAESPPPAYPEGHAVEKTPPSGGVPAASEAMPAEGDAPAAEGAPERADEQGPSSGTDREEKGSP